MRLCTGISENTDLFMFLGRLLDVPVSNAYPKYKLDLQFKQQNLGTSTF